MTGATHVGSVRKMKAVFPCDESFSGMDEHRSWRKIYRTFGESMERKEEARKITASSLIAHALQAGEIVLKGSKKEGEIEISIDAIIDTQHPGGAFNS